VAWRYVIFGEVVKHRKAVCQPCGSNLAGVCIKCGCLIAAKVHVASTNCPLGKWDSIEKPAGEIEKTIL